jgi:hypothetical protein
MSVHKVAIYPCGGIGLHTSCVVRLAGYLLPVEYCQPSVEILDMHRLICGLPDERELVEECPTIILDGCAHQCGSGLFSLLNIKPAARVYLPEVISQTGLFPGRDRKVLEESGQRLAREVAQRTARLAQAMLDSAAYQYRPQQIQADGLTLCDYEIDVEEALGYLEIAPAIYRPADMAPLPGVEEVERDPSS